MRCPSGSPVPPTSSWWPPPRNTGRPGPRGGQCRNRVADGGDVVRSGHPDHQGRRGLAGRRDDPGLRRQVATDVDDLQPGPAQRHRERQHTELVARATGQAHDHARSADVGRRRVEGRCQPTLDRRADEVLAGDGDDAAVPRVAQDQQRGHQPVVGDVLVVVTPEHLRQQPLQRADIELLRDPDQGVDVADRFPFDRRGFGRPCRRGLGDRPGRRARPHLLGSQPGRPACGDQRPHRREPRDGGVVVQAVAALAADRLDHVVTAFPHPQRVGGDAGHRRGVLDRVHGGHRTP